jgi:hypothetical protein
MNTPESYKREVDPLFDLQKLRCFFAQQNDAFIALLHSNIHSNTKVELVAIAATNRAIELCNAFLLCTTQKLLLVAPALTRMQLDSALRVFALRLVDSGEDLATHILEGKELRKYDLAKRAPLLKSKLATASPQLTDKFLSQQLSKEYSQSFSHCFNERDVSNPPPPDFIENSIEQLYNDGNKFIHLTDNHIAETYLCLHNEGIDYLEAHKSSCGSYEEPELRWTTTMFICSEVLRMEVEKVLKITG